MKLLDNFSYKNFLEGLLPFLNNFLSTSVLMAISLSAVIRTFNMMTIPMVFFMGIVILAIFFNIRKFVNYVINNPVPESVLPFHNAKGPKPLRWFIEFVKTLLEEKKYIFWGVVIFFILEMMMIASFYSAIINVKSLM